MLLPVRILLIVPGFPQEPCPSLPRNALPIPNAPILMTFIKRSSYVVGYDLMVEPGLEPEGNHGETWNRMAEQIGVEIRRAGAGNDQATPILVGPSGAR